MKIIKEVYSDVLNKDIQIKTYKFLVHLQVNISDFKLESSFFRLNLFQLDTTLFFVRQRITYYISV